MSHDSTPEERLALFRRQKHLLNTFLQTGAISPAQYNKSYGDLKAKMDLPEEADETD